MMTGDSDAMTGYDMSKKTQWVPTAGALYQWTWGKENKWNWEQCLLENDGKCLKWSCKQATNIEECVCVCLSLAVLYDV